MRLEEAWHFSTARTPNATHQIPGSTRILRWRKGQRVPIIEHMRDLRYDALRAVYQIANTTTLKADPETMALLVSSPGWEPVLPVWEKVHPLEALAHCADDEGQEEEEEEGSVSQEEPGSPEVEQSPQCGPSSPS